MFDFLKKKIGGFIDGLTKKEDEKEQPEEKLPENEPVKKIEEEPPKKEALPVFKKEPQIQGKKEARPSAQMPPKKRKPTEPTKEIPASSRTGEELPPAVKLPEPKAPEKKIEEKETFTLDLIEPQPTTTEMLQEEPEPLEKPKERVKLGIIKSVKSMITREVEISDKDVKDMVETLELEMLEADVEMSVAEGIKQDLMSRLVGSKVPKDQLHAFVGKAIKEALVDVLDNDKRFDILERVESSEKPLKIMFLGINGAGKTTTIAKVAKLLLDNKKKVVFAAADTFRAAAIEQMEVHADRLGVKVIKREYGSDPTSVAFDAVNFSKAHGIDAVLIDTAGRQDTNISLINEMKKMNRIIQPDIKVYIGESIAGNAIIEQISAFNREIGIDAVILTKLDCDPKGGTMLSINKVTGVPIIYVGVGQEYGDLERFDPNTIADRIVG